MFCWRPVPCLLGWIWPGPGWELSCPSFRECRTPNAGIVSWKFWKRMFHVCDFNGTILNFPDATDATKTYPIGTWSASDTPKILKFTGPRFGQWIQKGYPVTNSCSTLQLDFSPLIPAWSTLTLYKPDLWIDSCSSLVQILQHGHRSQGKIIEGLPFINGLINSNW